MVFHCSEGVEMNPLASDPARRRALPSPDPSPSKIFLFGSASAYNSQRHSYLVKALPVIRQPSDQAQPVLAREREARLNIRSLSQASFKQLYVADFATIMCIVPCTSKHLACTLCGLRPRLRRCLDHVQHFKKSSCNATLQPRCTKPCLQKTYQTTKERGTSDEHLPKIDPLRASETPWPPPLEPRSLL